MSSSNRRIQRVPALLIAEEEDEMKKKKKKNDYYPKVVSIGPHHHGKPELAQVEAFKPKAVALFVRGAEEMDFFYHRVLGMIGEVRNSYEEESVANLSDKDLAQMMLQDACLIITEMEIYLEHGETYHKRKAMIDHFGRLVGGILFRDFLLVENQIPLFVIKLLIKLRHGESEEKKMINNYINKCIYGEIRSILVSPWVPLHLLEFMHMVLVNDCSQPEKSSYGRELSSVFATSGFVTTHTVGLEHGTKPSNWAKKVTHSFRTVMDLKARGIHFRPSATQSMLDVKFKSGFFHATLQLPEMFVSHYSKPLFKNLVAYELLPGVETEPRVTSYIDLMQSLVERPGDLKELRERKIVYNQLGSDEEALNVFKDINTHGASDDRLYFEVREMIQSHYNNRIKTWIAELIHTHFRSPWTGIAFLAATAIIALTAAQLYYAAHPPQNS